MWVPSDVMPRKKGGREERRGRVKKERRGDGRADAGE
jgi:hypothetical protein